MERKTAAFIIFCLIAFAITAIFMIFGSMHEKNVSINQSSESTHIIQRDLSSRQLSWNNITLQDSTIKNDADNICYASKLGMTVAISPCTAQTITGRNIIQNVNFTWNGITGHNISAIFVYTGQLESGKMLLEKNVSYTEQKLIVTQTYVSNYLVNGVVNSTNLGTPNGSCQIGSNENNTQMYLVNQIDYPTLAVYPHYYCFQSVTVVNATAYRISGTANTITQTLVNTSSIQMVDISDSISRITSSIPSQMRGDWEFYQVQNVQFNSGQTYSTQWIYTPANSSVKGKWHILLYDASADTLYNAVNDGNYLYIDPWWNSSWTYVKSISGLSTYYSEFNVTYNAHMNSDFSDIRFTDITNTTELPYVRESYSAGNSATFRVMNVTGPAIEMYYGNAAATTASSISNLFGTGMLEYMPFNDNISITPNLAMPTKNNGTLNSVVWMPQGKSMADYYFTDSKYISLGNIVEAQYNDQLSTCAWANATTLDSNLQYILSGENNAGAANYYFRFYQNKYTWSVANDAGGTGAASSTALSAGQANSWHFVCGVYNGANIQVYIDGVANGSSAAWSGQINKLNSSIEIGRSGYSGGSRYFKGQIDDLMLWNRTITTTEITNMYNVSAPTVTFGDEHTESGVSITPQFSYDTLNPANGTTYSNGASYTFNITITNTNGTSWLQFNNANYSMANSTGSPNNFTVTLSNLAAGVYPYIYGSYYNLTSYNTTAINYYTVSRISTTTTLTTVPASPISYGVNSTFTCTNNLIPITTFTSNAVDISTQSGVSLNRSAGTYILNCSAAATQNYSGNEKNVSYIISKAGNTIVLKLNNTAGHLVTTYPSQVNASATAGTGTINYTKDGIIITGNVYNLFAAGSYNITATISGNDNYSLNTTSWNATVALGTPVISIGGTAPVVFPTETTVTCSQANTGSGDLALTLYREGAPVANPDVQTLAIGTYNYSCNSSLGQNWSAGLMSSNLIVSAAALHFPQWSSPSVNPVNGSAYSSGSTHTFSIDWTVSGSSINSTWITFNNTNYSMTHGAGNTYSRNVGDLAAGTYPYQYFANDTDGTTNYTGVYYYTVSKATPTGTISITPGTTVTNPTETTATASETNAGDGDVTYQLFRDNVLVGSPDVQTLDVGTFQYIYNTTGGQNISQGQLDSKTITVLNTSVSLTNLPYNTTSYPTSMEGFALNVTFDNTVYLNPIVTLNYNSVSYSTTESGSGSTLTFSRSIGVPSSAGEYYFNWTAVMTNTTGGTVTLTSTTSTQNISISPTINVTVNPCSPLSTAFTFTFADEQNLSALNASTVAYNIKYGYMGNTTAYTLNGTLSNKNSFNICVNNSYPYYSVGEGEISYQTSNSIARRFYIFSNTRLTNQTVTNKLYSLQSSAATYYQETVEDTQLNLYNGYYTSLLRWYPELDAYNTVEMSKTDNKGESVFAVQQNSVDYRIGVYSTDGTLAQLFPAIRFQCTVSPCTYTVFVNQNSPDYSSIYGIQSSLTYNSSNHRFTYIWNDPSQATTKMNLTAQQISSGYEPITICSNTGNGFTGVLVCDATGYSGTIEAKVTREASPAKYIDSLIISAKTGLANITNGKTIGLFIVFILGAFGALVGVFSPIAAIALGLFALIPAFLLGVIPYMVVVGFFIIGGIVFHFLRRT